MTHTISAIDRTDTAYGQVWIDGVTNQPGATPGLRAQLGFGPDGSDPDGNAAWTWVDAAFNVDAGNNDEFSASMLPRRPARFDYAYRYTTTGGRDWIYADLDGSAQRLLARAGRGADRRRQSGDTTAPATPAGLHVVVRVAGRASSSRGTRSPATRPCSATRSQRGVRAAARGRILARLTRAPPSPTPPSPRARRSSTGVLASTPRSTGRRPRSAVDGPPSCARSR